MRCGLPPPAARISVALLRKGTSCFGCSTNVNESVVLTSAAALDEDLGLEVDVGAALNIVAYVVAVFLWREPGGHPFTSIDAQSVSLNTLRVFVFALTPAIRYLKAFLEELVGLRLARARVSLKKVVVLS